MTCTGKYVYPSRRIANEAAGRTQAKSYRIGKTVHRMECYHCNECHGYHVTGHNGHPNLNKRNH